MRNTRLSRLVTMLSAAGIVFGFAGIIFIPMFETLDPSVKDQFMITFIVLFVAGLTVMLSRYLMYGRSGAFNPLFEKPQEVPHDEGTSKETAELLKRLSGLDERLTQISEFSLELTESDKATLLKQLRTDITARFTEDFMQEIENKYGEGISKSAEITDAKNRFWNAITRLENEIATLGRRGATNLAIGVATTVGALALLTYVIVTAERDLTNTASLLSFYIPRISLAVFIEVFSFFFLRLYRATLRDIKYYQNELTNVEARFISLNVALVKEDAGSLKNIVEKLATTERNFILKKDETTVDQQYLKRENSMLKDLLSAVSGAFGVKASK